MNYDISGGSLKANSFFLRLIFKLTCFLLVLSAVLSCFSVGRIFASATVATIGDKKYTSLADALSAAQENDMITLTFGSSIYGSFTVSGKKNITIDLNGATIIYDGNLGNHLLYIRDSSITIKNGTLDMKKENSAVFISGGSSVILDGVKIKSLGRGIFAENAGNSYIKVNPTTVIDSNKPCFFFNSASSLGKITLDVFGKLSSLTTAIYIPQGSVDIKIHDGSQIKASAAGIYNKSASFSLAMNGGSFDCGTGIYSLGGDIAISAGTILAKGLKGEPPNTGHAIYLQSTSLAVTNGLFRSTNMNEAIYAVSSSLSISGGAYHPKAPITGIVNGASVSESIINGVRYEAVISSDYKPANTAVQVAMLEPWGVRVSSAVKKSNVLISPTDYDTEGISGGVWFAIGEEKYSTADAIKNATGATYISGKADAEGFFCDYRGIYIYDFDKYISMVVELSTGENKIYSRTASYTMLELINIRLGSQDCAETERRLLDYMVGYHEYVNAYINEN